MQVADRFHLLAKLTAAAERASEQIPMKPPVDEPAQEIAPEPKSSAPAQSRARALIAQGRHPRVERYKEMVRLYREGHSQRAISRMLGASSAKQFGAFCDQANSPNVANGIAFG